MEEQSLSSRVVPVLQQPVPVIQLKTGPREPAIKLNSSQQVIHVCCVLLCYTEGQPLSSRKVLQLISTSN